MRCHPARLSAAALLSIIAVLAVAAASLSGRLLGVQAHAAAPFTPDDLGRLGRVAGWTQLQWNFVGPYGVDAPQAWGNLIAAGAPGGNGVTVAVLDTGVAYPADSSRSGASPDLDGTPFAPGYDFVENDALPADENGHGTHVASTIAEQTDNAFGLTGLAYGVRIMPVRVLDRAGDGDAVTIARGLRYAVEHGAKVINLSLNFDMAVTASEIPQLLSALEFAHRKGSLVVAGAGNVGSASVSFPARGPHVLAVGATTEHGCLASYSNHGTGLDLVAPGGGRDADIEDDPLCQPGRPGRSIYQVSLVGLYHDRFDVTGFIGTSMAAPHVAAAAALVVASGVLGANPSPDAIEQRLEQTARDLGGSGYDSRYGWGLIDAATATSPGRAERPASISP
jgi:serine protease